MKKYEYKTSWVGLSPMTFVELEENVVKLKGKDQHIGFIRQLIEEHNNMVLQISCLQIQLSTLRADLFSVINKIDDMYIK